MTGTEQAKVQRQAGVVVVGLGNPYRRDDGAGPVVAAQVACRSGARDIGPVVDPLDLLGRWDGADLAVVVDAIRCSDPPGTVRMVEMPAGSEIGVTSTHGISLGGVLRLARTIGRAPGRVMVVGIVGSDFGTGNGLSACVDAAVPMAVDRIVDIIEDLCTCA